MVDWSLRFDIRAGPDADVAGRYAAALELAAFADRHGAANIVLSEHHGVEDGYLPSPLVLAAAVAGVTSRVRLAVSALVLGLHDPLRAAEDTLVVDQLSGGRLTMVVALGYRRADFALFGLDLADRVALLEAKLPVYRAALRGEPFEVDGRTVQLTPGPVQRPNPPVLLGGAVAATARRAARLADGFWPMTGAASLVDTYREACAVLGRAPGPVVRPSSSSAVFVAHDPERAWSQLLPSLRHEVRSYGAWAAESGAPTSYNAAKAGVSDGWDDEAIRASGKYEVLTPEACVARAAGGDPVLLHPLIGGCPIELGWESVQLFVDEVLPRCR